MQGWLKLRHVVWAGVLARWALVYVIAHGNELVVVSDVAEKSFALDALSAAARGLELVVSPLSSPPLRLRCASALEAQSWQRVIDALKAPPPPPLSPLSDASPERSSIARARFDEEINSGEKKRATSKKLQDWQLFVDGYKMPQTCLKWEGEFREQRLVVLLLCSQVGDLLSRAEARELIDAVKPHSVIVDGHLAESEICWDAIEAAGKVGSQIIVGEGERTQRRGDLNRVREGETSMAMLAEELHTRETGKARTLKRALADRELASLLLFGASGRVRVCVADASAVFGLLSSLDALARDKDPWSLVGAKALLRRGLATESIPDCEAALGWLSNACSSGSEAKAFALGMADDVLRCMRLCTGDERISKTTVYACEILADIAPYLATAKLLSRVDDALAACLFVNLSDVTVCAEVCFALQQMGDKNQHLCVLAAMRRHRSDLRVAQAGAYYLRTLATDPQLRPALLQDGVVTCLVHVLDRFGGLPLTSDAVSALGLVINARFTESMVDCSEANRVVLKQALRLGKGAALIGDSDTEGEEVGQAIATAATLYTLASFKNNVLNLCDIGGHTAVLELMRRFSASWEVTHNSALVLKAMCQVKGVPQALLGAGMEEVFNQAMQRFKSRPDLRRILLSTIKTARKLKGESNLFDERVKSERTMVDQRASVKLPTFTLNIGPAGLTMQSDA